MNPGVRNASARFAWLAALTLLVPFVLLATRDTVDAQRPMIGSAVDATAAESLYRAGSYREAYDAFRRIAMEKTVVRQPDLISALDYNSGDPHPADAPNSVIPVEQIKGPIFTVCGELDALWHSCGYSAAITARLTAHHVSYPRTALEYPDAGHLVGGLDIFLNTTEFHLHAASRRQLHDFGGRRIPFLGSSDLAVFKTFFNRTTDWADFEDMIVLGALNVDQTLGVLVRYLGRMVTGCRGFGC